MLTYPKRRGHHALGGGAPRKVGGRGTEREIGPKPLSWFAQGETDEAEEAGSGLAILNHLSRL